MKSIASSWNLYLAAISLAVFVCSTAARAQLPEGWKPPARIAELSFDHEFARLGGRELRWGGTAGLQWARGSRRLSFRGRDDIVAQQTAAVRIASTWKDGVGVNVLMLQLGLRYTGLGASMNGWYFELGSGIAISDGTTFDMNSTFNFASYVGFGFWIRDLPNWMFGFRVVHISNGNTNPPNRSMNLFQTLVGISF